MSKWIKGNGSDLPDGTWAWICWNAHREDKFLGMSLEQRRDGGWGSNGAERDDFEEPRFSDDVVGKFGWIAEEAGYPRTTVVTHYMLIEVPDYPSDE